MIAHVSYHVNYNVSLPDAPAFLCHWCIYHGNINDSGTSPPMLNDNCIVEVN